MARNHAAKWSQQELPDSHGPFGSKHKKPSYPCQDNYGNTVKRVLKVLKKQGWISPAFLALNFQNFSKARCGSVEPLFGVDRTGWIWPYVFATFVIPYMSVNKMENLYKKPNLLHSLSDIYVFYNACISEI
jgi:hypothetical protein